MNAALDLYPVIYPAIDCQVINPAEDITAKDPLCFYLGTHMANWLWEPDADFPMCVSYHRLIPYITLHPATSGWLLDSGAYTELRDHGQWTVEPIRYVQDVDRFDREIGALDWAAPQDWMCEPWVIHGGIHNRKHFAGTGLSVVEHQKRTVANFLECRRWWPEFSDAECPIMPSVQGWEIPDYLRCKRMYEDAGVDLSSYPVVGLGSVCGRQGTAEITALAEALTPELALHGFGLKTRGLLAADRFTSADSLAWSYDAFRSVPLYGHTHKTCANCLTYARQWRTRLLATVDDSVTREWQGTLDVFGAVA